MTLAVILLSLSDVRLALSRRTSLASLSEATSLVIAESLLTWCLLDYPAQAHIHFARLDITYSALTRRKTAVSSGA